MFPKTITFRLYERERCFRKRSKEWVLSVEFLTNTPWVVYTWNKKPAAEDVEKIKDCVVRSCELYHKSISIPTFDRR